MATTKKNKTVVFIADNLTDAQAGQMVGELAKMKNRVAPHARTIGSISTKENMGKVLQEGWKKLLGSGEK